jgi:hypothetical protein
LCEIRYFKTIVNEGNTQVKGTKWDVGLDLTMLALINGT